MRFMKRLLPSIFVLLGVCLSPVYGQVSTVPSSVEDPTQPVTITVNIAAMDGSIDHVAALQAAVASGEDLYVWTWKPAEHPDGHPNVNGLGAQPWKDSNPNLIMTNNFDGTFSWTIIPTDFYEVSASDVFNEDIHFLVKPIDGGGYGDPDVKSEDLVVPVDPPALPVTKVRSFPSIATGDSLVRIGSDDVFTLIYDNNYEEKPSMQGVNDLCVYVVATWTDYLGTQNTTEYAPITQVGSQSELAMRDIGKGLFQFSFWPTRFFNLPEGSVVRQLEFRVLRQNVTNSNDVSDGTFIYRLSCF